MRSVKLKAKFFFLVLILLIASNGYSDICGSIRFHTNAEAAANKTGKGLANFFTFNWSNLDFDEKLLQYIRVTAIKDQGIDGYFNPRIQVCDYEGKDNCYQLGKGTSCRQIYGKQASGAGIFAAVFIDWEGDTVLNDGKFKEGIAKGLEWEWVDNVTDEEKRKFANSPKICACSQKAACMDSFLSYFIKIGEGANIFRPGDMANTCDTCYQEKVKCAPIPLAPGPPPFCEQLAMSPPQVRIVPVTDKDNDYFNPRVGVMISGLEERKGLGFPHVVSNNENIPNHSYTVTDKDTHYYFKTYRKKGQLCAEYLGTQSIDEKNPQFVRCFPAPPTPEPEVVEIVQSNASGKQSDTLKIRMKMSESACTYEARGTYSDGLCTFNVNTDHKHPVNIGPLSLKVVKPAIVAKTTDSDNEKSYIDNIIEGILESNPQQFKVLKEYGYVPDIETECKEFQGNKCKLNNLGQPEIEVKYKGNSNSKMLCLSGWQPEPEEFVLERENKIIPLKLMGTRYTKYNAVYSKESNQFYYLPSKEIIDPLTKPQNWLDQIIFNKQGYVFFPDENKQEKGKCSYCVDHDKDIDEKFINNKVKVVYKLIDTEHKEGCKQGDDGCICFNGVCSRSKQYLNKNEDDKPFYLRYEEEDCKDEDGKVLRDEKNEVQKCTQLKDQPIKADRTEVFYADKLCRFDLEGLKKKLKEKLKEKSKEIIEKEPEKKSEKSHDFGSGNHDVDGSQITSSRVEIEVWGCGEAGHIKDTPTYCKSQIDWAATKKNACSTETRAGMPGDYIKAELEIDPDYPIIDIEVSEGGGNREKRYTDKDGGPIFIRKCRLGKQECKDLITMGGGGIYKEYEYKGRYRDYMETIIDDSVKLKKETIVKGLQFTEDNRIAYIENGEIKYETVECNSGFRSSSKPGAGGCIDKSKKIYGKGSAGYVKVTPIIKGFDINIINDAIEKMIGNRYDLGNVRDFLTGDADTSIIKMIEEEIKKELLGLEPKDSKS
ncbi:hypothetical protein [Wolbachia endosymbiont (group A) of Anomoia purmunda]|uniref:hypothetical protein n=1 Tax=Wolbachia endosymbiont (group A) of Anomoia purmunda TaxID=2953978 RepID=UPI002230E716|nr:hypothetical protein [Wolbachia endosymbiont (group A) of Anomoia purmunda]